ncbi:MAG: glycosyltransferase family 4 protein, partial [Candidatus Curtissbacteria bacterium]|nr:glycosyltransferase family 4 protein [Candidatus Curtissbacteria bacterium]
MKVALVHDYLGEFGGAERVLKALCEIWPKAPIYTAFYREGVAYERFKNRKIITSWAQKVPFFTTYLHSPLRFLAPFIWNSFDFSGYDVIVSSSSWYVTKGFKKKGKAIEICYCHTPPRWLYGYATSVNFQKYPLVKAYAAIVGHFMRLYDFKAAQKVDYFIANSEEVAGRIK